MGSMDSMNEVYVYENMQLLEKMEETLLSNQSDTGELSQNEIEEIFRAMHTIKGASAMMGYESIMHLTHSIEDVFDEIRSGKKVSSSKWEEIIDVVLNIIDFLKEEMNKVQDGNAPDGDITELHTKAKNLLKEDEPKEEENFRSSEVKEEPNTDENNKGIHIKVFFDDGCGMEGLRALGLVMSLEGYHAGLTTDPKDLEGDVDKYIATNGLSIYITPIKAISEIEEVVKSTMFLKSYKIEENQGSEVVETPEIKDEEIKKEEKINEEVKKEEPKKEEIKKEEVKEEPKAVEIKKEEPKKEEVKKEEIKKEVKAVSNKAEDDKHNEDKHNKNNILSVNISKIDNLMNLVGEIVTTESMVEKLAQSDDFDRDNFEKQARRLHQLTTELQDVVMSIRMIPIAGTFTKMQRVVRDMSKKTGKMADLILVGEETEVDKTILESISDPIMHMVRNSMDHGLETPEERIALGKPEKGTVTLEAKNTGGDVVIVIKDDGRGLNRDAIIKKAIEKGITTKKPEEITDKEAYGFTLAPGFSTKEAVTEFSGRGVGMDVVNTNIKKLRGSITIDSEPGKGSMFIIRIPLTLAIIDGMKLAVENEIYIIPSLNIKEVFRSGSYELVKNPSGEEHSIIRGECFKTHRLSNILGLKPKEENNSEGVMILVESEIGNICIIVDKIIGQQNVVIKPIPHPLTHFEKVQSHMSGCSILEDGSISLIFDVNSIITK